MDDTASLQRRLTGLMFELCQTFSGSDCDKILDLIVTQCHGKLQQYVDNKKFMIHHTVAAAIQLDISPLTERVNPDTLTGPARNIAQALLRDTADMIRAGCMTRSHKFLLPGSLGKGAAGGAPLLTVFSSVVGCWPVFLPFFFVVFPCFVSLSLVSFGCSGRIGQSSVAMARCCNAAAG